MSLIEKIKNIFTGNPVKDIDTIHADPKIRYSTEGLLNQIELQALIDGRTSEQILEEALLVYFWVRTAESKNCEVIAYKSTVKQRMFGEKTVSYRESRPHLGQPVRKYNDGEN